MKISEMNGNEKTAFIQVIEASNWVVGGWENSVADGHDEEMPSHEELAQEIYQTVMTTTTFEGIQGGPPLKEIRFAGEAFIRERIERRLKKMGY